MKLKICMKMLKNLSEKCEAKFPATKLRAFSMVKIACLDNAFSLGASPVEGQGRKGEKGKAKK